VIEVAVNDDHAPDAWFVIAVALVIAVEVVCEDIPLVGIVNKITEGFIFSDVVESEVQEIVCRDEVPSVPATGA